MGSAIVRTTLGKCLRAAAFACTAHWRPFSRFIPISDSGNWVIGQEMREIKCLARRLGIKIGSPLFAVHGGGQSVFVGNHFDLLLSSHWFNKNHKLATAYFHGKPGQGIQEFDRCFDSLRKRHEYLHRIHVSCKAMRQVVLESGIDPEKVHLVPIGINLEYFKQQTVESRIAARKRFGVPQDSFVVGSFQKDGNGWNDGFEPKMIKGPDIFIDTMRLLKKRIGSLVVLLSGPARGYVKIGLQEAGVPYIHHLMREYSEVGHLYQALDAYVVSSREEGGPKSILESMASGIPLVSTRVGQANDLVNHGENGFLTDIENVEALVHWATYIFEKRETVRPIIEAGRATAEANSYTAQLPLWQKFFDGFVE